MNPKEWEDLADLALFGVAGWVLGCALFVFVMERGWMPWLPL